MAANRFAVDLFFGAFERPRVARGACFFFRDTRFRPLDPRRVGVRVAMLIQTLHKAQRPANDLRAHPRALRAIRP